MPKEDASLLKMPKSTAKLILQETSLRNVPLLPSEKFVTFCEKRGIRVSKDRLFRLSNFGIFCPIFVIRDIENTEEVLELPNEAIAHWFEDGKIIDPLEQGGSLEVSKWDCKFEFFYSPFQLNDLDLCLNMLSPKINLEVLWIKDETDEYFQRFQNLANQLADIHKSENYRTAIGYLCQFISNRYYPQVRTNMRTISIAPSSSWSRWISINSINWSWHEYAASWDAHKVATIFSLDRNKLRKAYETLSAEANSIDPLANWASLITFVKTGKKDKLKGKALLAQSYREAANMLRLLHQELYNENLPETFEIGKTILKRIPDVDVSSDARRHMELILNQYDLNPQPKLTLFVEGETEEKTIPILVEKLLGYNIHTVGIEIINLRGVDNFTGNKAQDKFNAIFRLVDYLNHKQTIVFLLLDNESYATRLKNAAKKRKSLLGQERFAIPESNIKLWKTNFEFDNLNNKEIADTLNTISNGSYAFKAIDIASLRNATFPGSKLQDFYKEKTGHDLSKIDFGKNMAELIANPQARKKWRNRPIMRLVEKLILQSARNPFPVTIEDWRSNQKSNLLGGKIRSK